MTVKVLQCKKCSKLYQPLSDAPYCPVCMEKLDEDFELVKEYIYNHPMANVVEISEETGVSEKDVFYFLKEGRLSLSEDNGMLLCESCGRSITTGRYCEECRKRMERELNSLISQSMEKKRQPSGLGRMHLNIKDR